MKVTGIEVKNIGILEDVKLSFDKPLMLFYGDLRQGKSTLLKAFKWAVGGTFPSDILRHGTQAGHIIINLQNGSITRSWYVGMSGETVVTRAREIVFIKDGRQVIKPAAEIQALLNPFITDPEYLAKLSTLDRKKYFVEMFSINTDALDNENAVLDREAKALRSEVKGYGEIDATPIEPVNLDTLRASRSAIMQRNTEAQAARRILLSDINGHNHEIEKSKTDKRQQEEKIANLNRQIDAITAEREVAYTALRAADAFLALKAHKDYPSELIPELTTEVDAAIEQGAAQNVRAEQAAANKKRLDEKQAKELLVAQKEARQRAIRDEKIALLAKLSESCGVAGLVFTEDGEFSYEGVQSGMLSTSQVMKLSASLSALYPEGLNITLLDRAECLGKSIFEYVARAKEQDKTILAAIVGERPAVVPADVGVFVVENGRVS